MIAQTYYADGFRFMSGGVPTRLARRPGPTAAAMMRETGRALSATPRKAKSPKEVKAERAAYDALPKLGARTIAEALAG